MPAHRPPYPLLPVLLSILLPLAAHAAQPEPLNERVDRVFEQYNRADSPGCALGVIRDGRMVYQKGYGQASLEYGLPIRPERTVFDIGSTSKQFTAAAILLLVQDGKLALDDDIRTFLPGMPDYGAPITVRHLLHHTSGLRDYLVLLTMAGFNDEDYTTDADALIAIQRQKALNFKPGSEHRYSNTGYFLLGQIVKQVSGKTLGEFSRERIFEPLGMKETRILENHRTVFPQRATAYLLQPDGSFGVNMSDWEQAGDGAVQTNLSDLAKWDANFYAPKIGGAWLNEQLQQAGRLNDGSSIQYARGLMLEEYRGQRIVAHAGAFAGYRSQMVRIPAQRMTVAVLCNLAQARPAKLALDVVDIYLEPVLTGSREPAKARAKPEAFSPPAGGEGAFLGRYHSPELQVTWEVQLKDGQLRMRSARDEAPLLPVAQDTFTAHGATIRMQRDAANAVSGFVVDTGRANGMKFERKIKDS
ncbi:beta-lactamase family protein [Massilia sp. MB5]|uniref:serine hydrolase domain-containing protein n=1 Tax=Massilia sp. MB5 TaxID=2919578 RepID=UPI001F10EDDB|nr:serine hydrolase domain-containing protein [Massilia sp. MB5]UMR29807.1 beta-lactamase family protein [Massilia sp. MB5]